MVLCISRLALLGGTHRGGLSLRGSGINFGSINMKNTRVGDVTGNDKKAKPNWVGLAIAVIRLPHGRYRTVQNTD